MNRLAGYLGGGLVTAVAAAMTALTRWAGPPIYCGDGWFHVRYATILRADGIARTFPWWQESFLATRFTDFNLLYHLLLIPFTFGNELAGARIASVVFAVAAMVAFWWCLRSLGVPWPAFWALLLLAAAPDFAYRLTYTRPLVLGLALTFAGVAAILRGRGVLAFVLTFLYAHTHCSFHLLPCFAVLHAIHAPRPGWRTFLWSLGGAVAGSVVTPYFPNNLSFWWTANVGVLKASWGAGDLLRVGTEMMPIGTDELLRAEGGTFLVCAVVVYALTRVERVSAEARTLLVTAGGFFALTLLSRRFAELWAPFSVLLAGVVARDMRIAERVRPRRVLVAALAVLVLAVGLRHTLVENKAAAAAEDPPRWRDAARFLRESVPAGETIFHLGWDEFPELFYEDTTHRYLIGQDATFFWATNPDRCRVWARLAHGDAEEAWSPVRETFGARWAFVPRRYRSFLRLARRDPRFTEVWADESAIVFRVDDDGTTVRGWEVSGWWAGPLGAGEVPPPVACSTGGFVDLAKAAGLPARVEGACASATSSIVAEAAGPAVLGVTTDDQIAVEVDGKPVYERSSRTPASLSAVLDGAVPGSGEVAVGVELRAGPNAVKVTSCRAGEDFGFILRVRQGDRP